MPPSATQPRKYTKACDRCYELKERCARASPSFDCARCERLQLVCSTVRPIRRIGRRPHHLEQGQHREKSISDSGSGTTGTTPSQSSTGQYAKAFDIETWLREYEIPDLHPEQKELLLFFLAHPQSLSYYVVNPSFENAERRSLAALLPSAFPLLKDAYLACAGSLRALQVPSTSHDTLSVGELEMEEHLGDEVEVQVNETSATHLKHANAAMQTLRSLPVVTPQDAALCVTLGIALAIFVYSTIGVGVSDICRYCLSRAKPFVESEMLDPETSEQSMTFLAWLEIMECLVHQQKPTLRLHRKRKIASADSGSSEVVIDRRLGLCLPLLPYFYDLCVINHSLATSNPDSDADILIRAHIQLDRIEADIEAWQPIDPSSSEGKALGSNFTPTDTIHLLAQARVYRLAALLLAHRLRHPFGTHDTEADFLSRELLHELELTTLSTKRPLRYITLPFIVAAIEVRRPSARCKTLRNVDQYVDQFTPVVQKAAKTFLARVWRERDMQITSRWFDTLYKPCAVLKSLEVEMRI